MFPARTAPFPGAPVLAALTHCPSEPRMTDFGGGVLLPVDRDGHAAGRLVSGCRYRMFVQANPCGEGFIAEQPAVTVADTAVSLRYDVLLPDPDGQPTEPAHDPWPGYTIEVVDQARPLDVWPCTYSTTRTIRATVMIPEGQGSFPLAVLGHGLGNTRWTVHETAKGYPPRGYIVVAPTFPAVAPMHPSHRTVPDLPNQPGDVSFLIDEILTMSETPGDPLYGKVDRERIGYEGVSGGAITGLLFFNECCADDRIDAVSAGMGYFLPPAFAGGKYRLRRTPAPALFMANNVNDQLIPFAQAVEGWEEVESDKFLAFGADDGSCFASHCIPSGVGDGGDLFMDAYVLGDDTDRDAVIELFGISTDSVTRQFVVAP